MKMPVWFIRETISEEYLRQGYHPTRITELTGLPEPELYRLRENVRQQTKRGKKPAAV
ncbi:MAG: hypothetical protein J4215_02860 [Candidatus Diapherotrites archaeon]|uniref:Uncharacterized protein n=1 Tax=Candidatus Iainarchaeum sp. TaxID=3101447 RepID=A0A8T4L4M0_9ARCH|nr:hypothetical protein [Candidatus Diapherotrites archaeon]